MLEKHSVGRRDKQEALCALHEVDASCASSRFDVRKRAFRGVGEPVVGHHRALTVMVMVLKDWILLLPERCSLPGANACPIERFVCRTWSIPSNFSFPLTPELDAPLCFYGHPRTAHPSPRCMLPLGFGQLAKPHTLSALHDLFQTSFGLIICFDSSSIP